MIGQPKYKIGDSVSFVIEDKKYNGTIHIIDSYGTFEYDEDVSYDILVNDINGNDCLFKHVPEKCIK